MQLSLDSSQAILIFSIEYSCIQPIHLSLEVIMVNIVIFGVPKISKSWWYLLAFQQKTVQRAIRVARCKTKVHQSLRSASVGFCCCFFSLLKVLFNCF